MIFESLESKTLKTRRIETQAMSFCRETGENVKVVTEKLEKKSSMNLKMEGNRCSCVQV